LNSRHSTNQTKLGRTSTLDLFLLLIIASFLDAFGRIIFPNTDTDFSLYAARYTASTGQPWNIATPLIDVITGGITQITRSPEVTVTITSAAISVLTTAYIYMVCKKSGMSRAYVWTTTLVNAMWFKPPVGGWIGDHLTFIIALAPYAAWTLTSAKYTKKTFLLGATTALCFTLKINCSVPTIAIAYIGIITHEAVVKHVSRPATKSIVKIFTCWLLGVICGVAGVAWLAKTEALHERLFRFTASLASSHSSGALAKRSILSIPFQIDWIQALQERKYGLLILLPVEVMWWVASIILASLTIGYFLKKIYASSRIKELTNTAFVLIAASTCGSALLGRGITHKLFMIPATILITLYLIRYLDFKRSKIVSKLMASTYALYMSILFGAFAWQHSKAQEVFINDPRYLYEAHPGLKEGVLYEHCLRGVVGPNNKKNCLDFSHESSRALGFGPKSRSLANKAGLTWMNTTTLEVPIEAMEKWNAGLRNTKEVQEWVKINSRLALLNKTRFIVEDIESVNCGSINTLDCAKALKRRSSMKHMLLEGLNSTIVSEYSGISIWKTNLDFPYSEIRHINRDYESTPRVRMN